jgi:hypothetical protein
MTESRWELTTCSRFVHCFLSAWHFAAQFIAVCGWPIGQSLGAPYNVAFIAMHLAASRYSDRVSSGALLLRLALYWIAFSPSAPGITDTLPTAHFERALSV